MSPPYAKLKDMAKAVFLDRDETLNPDPGYISDPEGFTLYPWVPGGLRQLKEAGYLLVVVSNQSGVGRGLIPPGALDRIHGKLDRLLMEEVGFAIDAFSICPHRPEEGCACRKPKPELLLRAAARLGISLTESFMIGDRPSDVDAGLAAGVRKSFLILPGDQESFTRVIREILETGSS
jgi:histidinol-phosphate phosphatase family protein